MKILDRIDNYLYEDKMTFTHSTKTGGKRAITNYKPIKNNLKYTIITHKLTKIDVEATAEDVKAKVKIDKPESLVIGENIVKITVTSEDGKDKTYEIVINNVEYDVDTSLKKIEIFGCDEELEFDPNVLDYEIRYKEKILKIDNLIIAYVVLFASVIFYDLQWHKKRTYFYILF